MSRPIVFMFCGQGSQYWGMGKELYQNHAVFRKWMLELDDLVRMKTNHSVIAHLYNDSGTEAGYFEQLDFSHPAIFMVEYALGQTLISMGIEPDIVIGSSLGEFAAAAFADVIRVETAIDWIMEQARIIQSSCSPGNMLAVLEHVDLYREVNMLDRGAELVSVNFEGHFVVAGAAEQMKELHSFLQAQQIISSLLPVHYAFHSSLIDPAAEVYNRVLQHQILHSPRVTMMSSVSGGVVNILPNEYFWQVVREPIAFRQAIQQIERTGSPVYIDLSPSSTLANFVKRDVIRDQLACYPLLTPFHQELNHLKILQNRLANGW